MNERIKHLLEQAGVSNNWNNADWYSLSPAMVEKFAELIVRECTLIVSAIDRAQLRSGEYVDPAEMITKHFGVEL